MSRRGLLRVAELALVAVVAVVLPTTVHGSALYLELAGPCLVAAGVLGWIDARNRHR